MKRAFSATVIFSVCLLSIAMVLGGCGRRQAARTDGTGTGAQRASLGVAPAPGAKTVIVNVYFMNTKKDPAGLRCYEAYPVERTVSTSGDIGSETIQELLNGPTPLEASGGYVTAIPASVRLQKLTLTNGLAEADFDHTLEENVGGSCRVASIRAQITQTLKQFPAVHDLIIAVDGSAEDALQP
jgi:spore germination protein GerM